MDKMVRYILLRMIVEQPLKQYKDCQGFQRPFNNIKHNHCPLQFITELNVPAVPIPATSEIRLPIAAAASVDIPAENRRKNCVN